MKILGIDPGIAIVGYGLIEVSNDNIELLTSGSIQTDKNMSDSKRLLEIYNDFPLKSEFHHPNHVPAGVKWARFRLEGDQRLIGFMIDKTDVSKFNLYPDVFYIVFLDLFHKFYISKK